MLLTEHCRQRPWRYDDTARVEAAGQLIGVDPGDPLRPPQTHTDFGFLELPRKGGRVEATGQRIGLKT